MPKWRMVLEWLQEIAEGAETDGEISYNWSQLSDLYIAIKLEHYEEVYGG